jgi:hypothetical protein
MKNKQTFIFKQNFFYFMKILSIFFLMILVFSIPSIYAETISTTMGYFTIDESDIEISEDFEYSLKIYGMINSTAQNNKGHIQITFPDGTTDGTLFVPNFQGYFESFFEINSESQLGKYNILGTYGSQIMGSLSFSVSEMKFTEQEIKEIRDQNISDEIVSEATALKAEQEATALKAEQETTALKAEQEATALKAEQETTAQKAEQEATALKAEQEATALKAEQEATALKAEQEATALKAEQTISQTESTQFGTSTEKPLQEQEESNPIWFFILVGLIAIVIVFLKYKRPKEKLVFNSTIDDNVNYNETNYYETNSNKTKTVSDIYHGNITSQDLKNNFRRLSWENAEDLVALLFKHKGYSVKIGSPSSNGKRKRQGDYGIDVEAKSDTEFLGIQVKHWTNNVGFDDIAKTLGVAQKFNKVIIVSTKAGFSRQARKHANDNSYLIELWDSNRFKQELKQHLKKK